VARCRAVVTALFTTSPNTGRTDRAFQKRSMIAAIVPIYHLTISGSVVVGICMPATMAACQLQAALSRGEGCTGDLKPCAQAAASPAGRISIQAFGRGLRPRLLNAHGGVGCIRSRAECRTQTLPPNFRQQRLKGRLRHCADHCWTPDATARGVFAETRCRCQSTGVPSDVAATRCPHAIGRI